MKRDLPGAFAVAGKLVIIFLIGVLPGACASIPHDPNFEGEPAGAIAEPPRCVEFCWIMTARNHNYSAARVYINGRRVATLGGMTSKDVGIPITRSMLDGTGCMTVFVKLLPDTKSSSSTACPAPGARLDLAIEGSSGGYPLHLWLKD